MQVTIGLKKVLGLQEFHRYETRTLLTTDSSVLTILASACCHVSELVVTMRSIVLPDSTNFKSLQSHGFSTSCIVKLSGAAINKQNQIVLSSIYMRVLRNEMEVGLFNVSSFMLCPFFGTKEISAPKRLALLSEIKVWLEITRSHSRTELVVGLSRKQTG